MDEKLTTTEQESFDFRIACSVSHTGSPASHPHPQRAGATDLQGARFESAQIERYLPTTVAARQPGGAFHSKWTRKTRPWNASLSATVVASIEVEIEEEDPREPEFIPVHHDSDFPSERWMGLQSVFHTFSGLTHRGQPQGALWEIFAAKLSERTAASTASPSDVRSGGEDRDATRTIEAAGKGSRRSTRRRS